MTNAPTDLALLRYQVISAYISLDPRRGGRTAVLQQLANKTWTLPDGRQVKFAAETLRGWVRLYRTGGLAALEDAPRARRGVQVLADDQIELVCRLKREQPSRSVERVIEVAEELELAPKGLLKRSTVHRVLQAHGLSARKRAETTVSDLDRFEAVASNDLWQSDMMSGPWLPDPERPGKQKRPWLHAFIDDHSRLVLAGRFAFNGDLPTLELVFREALRRHGAPRRVYYDNGGPYRAKHMAQAVAVIGAHTPVHTEAYRPEGHGKIEAFNRYCRAAFVDEVRASSITTLDELNRAFRAWVDLKYNRRVHGETGETPWERWRAGAHNIQAVDEGKMRAAFLFRATRTTDKTGLFKLSGQRFQTSASLARKKVEVRYDPEDLTLVEVWFNSAFQERVGPFEVQEHRRAQTLTPQEPTEEATSDYLRHLVGQHAPAVGEDSVAKALAEREAMDDGVVELLRGAVHPDVFDEAVVREFLLRFGPFEPDVVAEPLRDLVALHGRDQHLSPLLTALKKTLEVA